MSAVERQPQDGATRLCLSGEWNIYSASERRQQWLAVLEGITEGVVELDATAVEEPDSTAVQLLQAGARQLSQRGCQLRLHGVSPALGRLAVHLGLDGGSACCGWARITGAQA